MQQLLVSPAELAAMLGLSLRTIYHRLQTNGDLPTVIRIGRLPRFAIVDVHIWLDAKRNTSTSSTEQASAPVRRRGRPPTQGEQIAKRHAGSGV